MNELNRAADALRAGQKAKAQKLLNALLKSEPSNAQAWYLLSHAVDERSQQISALKRTLRLSPGHPQARARLAKLTGSSGSAAGPAAPSRPAASSAPGWVDSLRPPARSPDGYSDIYSYRTEYDNIKPEGPNKALVLGGVAVILLIFCLAAVGFWWIATWQPSSRVAAASPSPTATEAPLLTLPPTWTATFAATSTPTSTRTPTPVPSETGFPTPAPPGPTALYYMQVLEAQVMDIRGLGRMVEVPRYVTNRAAYLSQTGAQEADGGQTLQLLQMEWAYKALGILTPDFDLLDYNEKVGASGAAAVYVPEDKSIYVFGLQFTGAEAWFYVHEYDHALVDQNFDLSSLGVYPQCMWDSQRCMAIRALVEGDATLLMYLWLEENAGYQEYRDLFYYVPPSSLSPGQKQPPGFVPMFNFPYIQGLDFVNYLHKRGGWKLVNQAYQNLPASTEQILHPQKYMAGEQPVGVTDPDFQGVLGADYILVNSDSLGEWETHVMLAYGVDPLAQIDAETALAAAQGWGGDHYQVYRNFDTGQTVMSAHWAWDTQYDATQFAQAMENYQAGRFNAGALDLGRGTCRMVIGQVSCVLTYERETVWLLAPNEDTMRAIMGLYP
ncbi:MAG: hypothetical protein ACOYYS_21485 [Chloroflexota bacterium]